MENFIIYAIVFGIWLLAQMFSGGGAKEKERQKRLQQERMRRLREQREAAAGGAGAPGGTGGADPAEDMQSQMREVFRRLGVETEEPAQRSSRAPEAAPPPVLPPDEARAPLSSEEKEHNSLRAQLARRELETKEREHASSVHADALGRGAEEHTRWEEVSQERDLVSLDEAEEKLAARMEAAMKERVKTPKRGNKIDLSKKSLVNALILGEVLNNRGGSWSRNE